jgi:hypothetical protein
MRGSDAVSYLDLEARVPPKHPLRIIRAVVNEVLLAFAAASSDKPEGSQAKRRVTRIESPPDQEEAFGKTRRLEWRGCPHLCCRACAGAARVQRPAATTAPTMLATSTTLHMRVRLAKFLRVGSAMTGSTTVIVFSVKSCCRARTTIKNPTE